MEFYRTYFETIGLGHLQFKGGRRILRSLFSWCSTLSERDATCWLFRITSIVPFSFSIFFFWGGSILLILPFFKHSLISTHNAISTSSGFEEEVFLSFHFFMYSLKYLNIWRTSKYSYLSIHYLFLSIRNESHFIFIRSFFPPLNLIEEYSKHLPNLISFLSFSLLSIFFPTFYLSWPNLNVFLNSQCESNSFPLCWMNKKITY